MLYTNDLCRLASKARLRGLHKDDIARLQADIEAIKHLATGTISTSCPPPSSPLSSFSTSASQPASPWACSTLSSPSPSPPASSTSGFLSSTLSALSTNVTLPLEHQGCAVADLHKVVGEGPKRRNRGKNLPKDIKRACAICKAEKTSQWRSGADGRPTLCNACGLRYRHSMKQHRQYLARQQLDSSAGPLEVASTSEAVVDSQQRGGSIGGNGELLARLRELQARYQDQHEQQQHHLSKVDSSDTIDGSDDVFDPASPSSCSVDVMPRRSSIYSLLN